MGSTKLKLLLAGFFVTGGLGLGVGTGWINTAGAQQAGGPVKEKGVKKEADQQQEMLTRLDSEKKALEAQRLQLKAEMEATEQRIAQTALRMKRQADEAKLAAEKAQQLKYIVDALDYSVELNLTVDPATAKDSPKWQYDIVPWEKMKTDQFKAMLAKREKDGWEFVGSNDFTDGTVTFVSWIFRKSTKPTNMTLDVKSVTGEAVVVKPLNKTVEGSSTTQTVTVTELAKGKPGVDKQQSVTVISDGKVTKDKPYVTVTGEGIFVLEDAKKRYEPSGELKLFVEQSSDSQVKELKAQIEKLQAQLAKVQQQPKSDVLSYAAKDASPEAITDALDTLTTLGAKKFPNDFKVTYQKDTARFMITGSPTALKWATGMLDKLVGQRPTAATGPTK